MWISPRFYFPQSSHAILKQQKKLHVFLRSERERTLSNFMLFINGSLFNSMFHIHNHITWQRDIKTKVKKMTMKIQNEICVEVWRNIS